MSLNNKRSCLLIIQQSDVALPMNLDQVDVVDIPDLTGKPVEEPTDSRMFRHPIPMPFPDQHGLVFHLYQSQFHRLSGRIWEQCFCVTLPTYRVVVELEEQLRKFELELP